MEPIRRRKIALEGIDPCVMVGLEIGPLSHPIVDKREGYRVKYVDHDSTAALRSRFAGDPNVRSEDIVDVDYVVGNDTGMLDLITDERFDYILASHVFEHVPNPVLWLQEMYALLNPGGRLSLIIPDRRYTFDVIRPQTSLGEWLEAYYTERKRPTFSNVFDQNYYWRVVDAGAVWAGTCNPWALEAPESKKVTLQLAQAALSRSDYIDVHCNIVTDSEFAFLFSGLREYGLTEFELLSLRPCEPNELEFFVQLGKAPLFRNKQLAGRDSQTSSHNQAVVDLPGQITDLSRVVSERDEQIVKLIKAISIRDVQIANLSQAVQVYQNSTSWRVTRPLRIIGDQIKRINHALAETKASRRFAQGPLRFHIDRPIWIVNIVKDSCLVSGWAVNLEAGSAAKVRIVIGKTLHHPHPEQREDVRRMFGPLCELPRDTGFAMVLTLPVGIHRMWIEVKGVDGVWIPIRWALLLRIPGKSRTQGTEPRLSYNAWARLDQKRLKAELPDIRRHIDVMLHKPVFTVIVDPRPGVGLEDTIRSIRKQLYPYCEVSVLAGVGTQAASSLPDDVKTLKDTSLSDIRGDFIVFMQSGQRLAINALYEFASAINQYPDIDLVYGDEDSCTPSGRRCDPFYKPGWSPDYLETFNYIGFPACFRTTVACGCFDKAHIYDFVLRFTERTTKVLHIAKILGHVVESHTEGEAASANAVKLDIAALSGRLNRTGRRGSVREHELHKGCYEIRLDLKRSPLVSVVIPTAGKTVKLEECRIDLIENVIRQIRDRSTYKNIEIIVVDNGDLSPSQMRLVAEAECRRITYSSPVFNIAKKLNLGASIANGELLLLMNDDIEILTPSWIERLLEHFEKPHVGVVGAKLLYPDEQTQHVGIVLNFGNPNHVRRLFPRNDAGYFFSTCGVRNYSAVTGACMMTPTSIYREVGGFSEEFAVTFNDVDFCMKVRQKGLWTVYAPSVELIHMESQSHVASADIDEVAWYHQRWAAEIVSDEFYNERFLTVASPTFVPCVNQRIL